MIHVQGDRFVDKQSRTLMLRGVNLGGSSKVPFKPDGATHIRDGFFDHRDVSFVGRPFPLEQADEHLSRLRKWGLTFLRFLVTWEAVEHAGPGLYDEAYLEYLYAVVKKAGEHGLDLFIDPHQDVWSRFSGGDGAPGWTFEAVGMDVTQFSATGAAILHQTHREPYPIMVWGTNATKLAAATMFTLFFGGDDFAPQIQVDGEPVQGYLQRHYINAMQQVALRLKGLPNVVGYDTMNEPLSGFIGWPDLSQEIDYFKIDLNPSPFQGMLLGAGHAQALDVWEFRLRGPRSRGRRLVNPDGARAWRDGVECVWKRHGVWDVAADGEPRLLRPDYFTAVNGRKVDFNQDYYRPFANRYAAGIRAVDPDALIFIETAPVAHAAPRWSPDDAANVVYAPHWYDVWVIMTKDFSSFLAIDALKGKLAIGPGRIRRAFARHLGHVKQEAAANLGQAPLLVGEFGIAFDIKNKRAYRSGDWSAQVKALDRSFRAMEDNLLSCTLWNYTADNTNQHGDQWNKQDYSIFSRDQQTDPDDVHSGGRALEAAVRPYARRIAGEPLRMSFDVRRKIFQFEFRHDPALAAPTEIFVPDYQYPRGYSVALSDGRYEVDGEEQTLIYHHSDERDVHQVTIKAR